MIPINSRVNYIHNGKSGYGYLLAYVANFLKIRMDKGELLLQESDVVSYIVPGASVTKKVD